MPGCVNNNLNLQLNMPYAIINKSLPILKKLIQYRDIKQFNLKAVIQLRRKIRIASRDIILVISFKITNETQKTCVLKITVTLFHCYIITILMRPFRFVLNKLNKVTV